MINKLRFRFIRITMIAILIVLTLIITTINIVNFRRNTQTLDAITQRLTKNQLSVLNQQSENTKHFFDFTGFNLGKSFFSQNEKELPYTIRFFSMHTDKNKNLIRYNLRQIVSVNETDLETIKEKIFQKKESVGWYHSYRYRVSETDSGYLLIVLEASSTLSSMLYVLFLTLVVGAISVLLLFIIITIFSKRAIQPIVDAYAKQKQFITDASHELKTPLTVISANAEILSLSYGENE